MTHEEQDLLLMRLTELAEYYEQPKSDAQLTLYVRALDDLPLDAVLAATVSLVKTNTFFPRINELRQLVDGVDSDTAELAWMQVIQEIRRVGWVGQPQLSDATMETIRGLWGGWVNLCQTLPSEGPELLGWAKRFGSAYVATRHRLERPEVIGRAEAQQLHAYYTGGGQQPFPRSLPHSERAMPVLRRGSEDPGDVLDRDDDV